MAVFYPSCVCHLKLRFDEAFTVNDQPDPVSTRQAQSGLVDKQRPGVPLILDVSPNSSDNLSVILNRVPKSASFDLSGYRQAWTFNMTFDYHDLPIDPRVVRSCGVDIHIGAVDPADFSTGMVKADANGRRRSILRTVDNGVIRADTFVMTGIVDSWHVKHAAGSSEISFEGRDQRGILLGSPIDPLLLKNLKLEQPLDAVIRDILERHPFGEKIPVEVSPDDWVETVSGPTALPNGASGQSTQVLPSPATKSNVARHLKGADGVLARIGAPGGSGNLNYWDLITHYCFLVGAIPYFGISQTGKMAVLRIRPSRSLFDQLSAGADPAIATPFAGGKQRVIDGKKLSIRRLTFGRDVAELSFERKFTGSKPQIVVAVGFDSSSAKRGTEKEISAQYPSNEAIAALKKAQATATKNGKALALNAVQAVIATIIKARASSVSPSGQQVHEEVLRVPVPGITDKKVLAKVAESVFLEVSNNNEMGGSVRTRNLASFGGGNADPDMTRLRPGDAVDLVCDVRPLVSDEPLMSTAGDLKRKSFNELAEDLKQRLGGDTNLARVVAASVRGAIVELQTVFRAGNVKFDWSIASGLGVAFDFHNFVVARSDASATRAQASQPTVLVTSSGKRRVARAP